METVDLLTIPLEIIEVILENDSLTFVDVCNFGSTCVKYWELVHTRCNRVWKTKFKQLWPHLVNHEAFYSTVPDGALQWIDEFRTRWTVGQSTVMLLKSMASIHIRHEELSLSDFKPFEEFLASNNHKLGLQFIIDELMMCLHRENRFSDLTNKYYALRVLRHLRQVELTSKWEDFKNTVPEHQLLEKGAVIAAQWSEPSHDLPYHFLGSQLDDIAGQVRVRILRDHNAGHAALVVPDNVSCQWKTTNLSDNYYSPHVTRQVLNAVSSVLFQDLGFTGNNGLLYSWENWCIDKVLMHQSGTPLLISILYESVARRLGVKCEPVIFSGHFLLRWTDSYRESEPVQHFYIDVYNGGRFLDRNACPKFAEAPNVCPFSCRSLRAATALQVVAKLCYGLEMACRQCSTTFGRTARLRSVLELQYLIVPNNLHNILQLVRFYMQYFIDASHLQQLLGTITFEMRDMGQAKYIMNALRDYAIAYNKHRQDSSEAEEVKTRSTEAREVKYAVGMVMLHRVYNYTCVLVGWDRDCCAGEEWIKQMNVRSLARKNMQPFYNVLATDGTKRYVAEDNLQLRTADCYVTHSDIGRYFEAFCGAYYWPNTELRRLYPQDLDILKQYHIVE